MRHRYEPVVRACNSVRRDLRAFVRPHGLDDDLEQDLILVVSELAANAVDHARTTFSVAATVVGDSIRVEVEDGSTQPPRLRPPGSPGPRGYGLVIVDALSSAWSVTRTATGKVVRAEFAIG